MKKYVFLIVLWLSTAGGSARAKTPPTWSSGELVLSDGTVLTGELNYNWKAEIVQLRQANVLKAFSAYQVRGFRYFDHVQNSLRKFIAMEYPVNSTVYRPLFLEEMLSGPLTVYRRLRHTHQWLRVVSPASFGRDDELIKDVDNFSYFVIDGNKMIDLDDFRRTLWPRMESEFDKELKRYVTKMQVNLSSTLARLLLINHYNYLKLHDSQTAASTLGTSMAGH